MPVAHPRKWKGVAGWDTVRNLGRSRRRKHTLDRLEPAVRSIRAQAVDQYRRKLSRRRPGRLKLLPGAQPLVFR